MNKQTTTLIMATAAMLAAAMTTTAHGDHVHNIWIETTSGNYITYTNTAENKHRSGASWTTINEVKMLTQKDGCGDPEAEREYVKQHYSTNGEHLCIYHGEHGTRIWTKENCRSLSYAETADRIEWLTNYEGIAKETELRHTGGSCSYWYANTIKNKYTYTIIDLPRDREIPPNYKQIVAAGVQAGFDKWGDINGITFTHTDSRLKADIIVQQHIGNGREYGNANINCLFDEDQCTIQLFTDINAKAQQTLTNAHSIEWTIAHEFGHLIGLPHHIEPDHIMNTIHDRDVREYWEARNINVPRMTEPTYEQRLLENYNDYLNYANEINTNEIPTDIDEIMRHETVTKFLEFIQIVILNTPEDDRLGMWWDIAENAYQALRSTIHP